MNQNNITACKDQSMRLGNIEFAAMNNCIRRFFQKHFEITYFKKLLKKNNIDLTNSILMDAGCGSGFSTQLLLDEFKPRHMYAFDYMPEQITIAKKRGLEVDFHIGDMRNIKQPDNFYDAVFIFGVIHHIPDWSIALSETYRCLKSGGCLLLEEPLYRFSWRTLETTLRQKGFEILGLKKFIFGYMHSYLCRKV
jgi:ubiquinone/menaquinone biosynthesis C-methylase UbiE